MAGNPAIAAPWNSVDRAGGLPAGVRRRSTGQGGRGACDCGLSLGRVIAPGRWGRGPAGDGDTPRVLPGEVGVDDLVEGVAGVGYLPHAEDDVVSGAVRQRDRVRRVEVRVVLGLG